MELSCPMELSCDIEKVEQERLDPEAREFSSSGCSKRSCPRNGAEGRRGWGQLIDQTISINSINVNKLLRSIFVYA